MPDPLSDATDAARYRWLRTHCPDAVVMAAWRVVEACKFDEPDQAVDAAMAPGAVVRAVLRNPEVKEVSHG